MADRAGVSHRMEAAQSHQSSAVAESGHALMVALDIPPEVVRLHGKSGAASRPRLHSGPVAGQAPGRGAEPPEVSPRPRGRAGRIGEWVLGNQCPASHLLGDQNLANVGSCVHSWNFLPKVFSGPGTWPGSGLDPQEIRERFFQTLGFDCLHFVRRVRRGQMVLYFW
jgi:hypothetical protein